MYAEKYTARPRNISSFFLSVRASSSHMALSFSWWITQVEKLYCPGLRCFGIQCDTWEGIRLTLNLQWLGVQYQRVLSDPRRFLSGPLYC